jgi:NADH-quinone oxidoreductase subunit K
VSIGPGHYAVLSAIVFALGLFGVVTRTQMFGVLMAIALLFAAPVIALVGFTHVGMGTSLPPLGDALALFAVVGAGVEGAVGIAIAMLVWRRIGSSDVDDLVEVDG